MYLALKKILKVFSSVDFREAMEPSIRKALKVFYNGNRFECNVCQTNLKSFVVLSNGQLLCPSCGSLPRSRRILQIIESSFKEGNKRVLHFSPRRGIEKKLEELFPATYTSSNFDENSSSSNHFDITNIPLENESFDLIIASHILEHVENHTTAIKELYRVSRKNGKIIFHNDFREDVISQYPNKTSDFVFKFKPDELKALLEQQGFEVKKEQFSEEQDNKMGLQIKETVLIATKP